MMPTLPAKDAFLAHANEYHATAELLHQAKGSVIGGFSSGLRGNHLHVDITTIGTSNRFHHIAV